MHRNTKRERKNLAVANVINVSKLPQKEGETMRETERGGTSEGRARNPVYSIKGEAPRSEVRARAREQQFN
jgi:hypothetical protein